MLNRAGTISVLAALALSGTIATANAECHKAAGTLLGAGAGSIVLGALTHSPAGWVAGAVLGGVAGHTIASDNCRDERHHYRRGYYDRDHHWHYYS
ncbi:MAG TPA: hypothetical protein VN154_00390 [Rhizomicrobium sp.]|nr:hypothetical protein [Rhizomicrobium sp.]